MKFKIDENLPIQAAQKLRAAGHDVMTIVEQEMVGHPDESVAKICRKERRVLVTLDLDFADIRAYPPHEYPGILVLRLLRQDKAFVLDVLDKILPFLNQEPLDKRLWIVEKNRIRIRP